MGLGKVLSSAQKESIFAVKKLGHSSNATIAKVVGCHQTTVTRYLVAYEFG